MLRLIHRLYLAMLYFIYLLSKGIWFVLTGNRKRTFYGTADYMNFFQREKLLSRFNDGVFIENNKRLPLEISYQHIQIVASTGQGKTTRYILNNLLRIQAKDSIKPSLIILDPTKEIFQQSSGYLSRFYNIRMIDFSAPNYSDTWNPLSDLESQMDMEMIADVLVRSVFPKNSGDSFWNESAKSLLTILIRCIRSDRVEVDFKNIHNIRYLLNQFGKDGSPLNSFFSMTADEKLFSEIQGLLSNSEKVLLSIVSTAKTVLRLWANDGICRLTSSNSFEFNELREKPTCLYISLLESEIKAMQPIVSLLLTRLFSFLMKMPTNKKEYNPVFVFLEEIGQFYIPNLDMYVSTLRKRNVSLSFINQSLDSQMEHLYGIHQAETISTNINNKIIFPLGMDLKSAEKVERMMGNQSLLMQRHIKRSLLGFSTQMTLEEKQKPLMTAQQLRTMKHPILFSGNQLPTVLNGMNPFYSNRKLLKRSKLPSHQVLSNDNSLAFMNLNDFSVK